VSRVAGSTLGKLGADIRTPFEDRTFRPEDGAWTPGMDEEGVMFPVGESHPDTDLMCTCGAPYEFKGQMEFLYEGRYDYTHDAICPGCGTRAAVTTQALIQ